MKVLFLDMDGVMNDAAFYEWSNLNAKRSLNMNELNRRVATHINHINAMNLLYILKEMPELRIVISSTWRKHFKLNEIQYMLGKVGIPKEKVIGMTEVLASHLSEGKGYQCVQRGDLCINWATNNKVEEFVCVDDDDDFDNCRNRFVRTNYKNGLTRTKAEEILKLFGKFQEEANMFSRDVYGEDAKGD